MQGRWIYVVAALLALLLVFFLYRKYRVAPPLIFENITLSDLKGNAASLHDYDGKPLVLSFAASWCGPCVKELRELKKVNAQVQPRANIVVISDEPVERIMRLRESGSFPFEFLKMENKFSDIGINSIPTTYLLNAEGQVVKEKVGYIDWSDPGHREHILQLMSN